MHASLQKNWQSLEAKRSKLFAELDQIPPSVLNAQPAPNAWTVNQNLLHLMDAEAASLKYIQKKLSFSKDIPKAGLGAKWRRFLLKVAFGLPLLKFKAPTSLPTLPETADYAALKQRWATQRADYQTFLDNLEDRLVDTEIWKHAAAGKMSLAQMLDFFEDHFDRHHGQIKRTLRQLKS